MSVLNQPKKNQESLIAVSINDKLNTKHKKGNEYFKDDKQTYWIIDNNFQIPDFAYVLRRFFHKLSQPINVDINSFLKLVKSENVIGVINAFFSVDALATQKYSLKTKNVPKLIQHNFILDAKFYKDAIKVAQVLAEAEVFASELINMPGNILNADKFESICKNKFIGLKNVQLDVLHKNDLTQKKMGLILAVGQSSSKYNEPRIITAKYANGAKNKKTVALIGKGLMFDTGGLNLKPGEYMKSMHTDMAGAAISLATIYALAKLQIPANVTSIAAIASNEIGPSAYRVNDVIKSYSGATVEIMDTDAEGRLVLADAISYAKKDLKVDTVVTIATLTGSIMVALGHLYIGIWASNKHQWLGLVKAANQAPELIWQMPLHTEYMANAIKNTGIADIANIANGRWGAANVAAEFLHYFAEDLNFIHADICGGVEFENQTIPVMIRTLFYFVKDFQ